MIRRPPRSTLFPTRRSSDLACVICVAAPIPCAPPRILFMCFGSACRGPQRPIPVDPQVLGALHQTHCRYSRSRRSEEHTSELQSQSNLVCRLLLEKKKTYGT